MPSFIYNAQVLKDEQGTRWQVARYSVEENYVALTSLDGPRAVEVRALTSLLASLGSGSIRQVLVVDRSGNPVGPKLADLRRMPFPPPVSTETESAAPVRVDAGSSKRASRAELVRTGLTRFMQRRGATLAGKA